MKNKTLRNIIGAVSLATLLGCAAVLSKKYDAFPYVVEAPQVALQDTSYEALQQRRLDGTEEAHQSLEAYLRDHTIKNLADDVISIGKLGPEKVYLKPSK